MHTLPLLPLLLPLLPSAHPHPLTTPTPPTFQLKSITYGGSGCPQNTLNLTLPHTTSTLLPLTFGPAFSASVGPSVAAEQSRKNCQISLALQFSPGWQYAVYSAEYKGWGALEEGVKGVVGARYYFGGEVDGAQSTLDLPGPFTGTYSKHDDVPVSVWSPCGSEAMLNINAEVALTPLGSQSSGQLVATSEKGGFTHEVGVRWREC